MHAGETSPTHDGYASTLLARIGNVMQNLDISEQSRLKDDILSTGRLFLMGSGRSGLIGRMFAMRIMHLGIEVYVVGETNTPRITNDDLLIAISGSGNTPAVVSSARKARSAGARVVALTIDTQRNTNALEEWTDYSIRMERRHNPQERWAYALTAPEKPISVLPMGSLFELSALLFLETLICTIIMEEQIPEDEMRYRHTILE
ncbi:MAG: SIS domain-containing protein [Gammaproteobacteria bacterium]|nr:SIS domain-containing protein [Gammaproteobacteria bacterium]